MIPHVSPNAVPADIELRRNGIEPNASKSHHLDPSALGMSTEFAASFGDASIHARRVAQKSVARRGVA
jgi:hypothetical protein